MEGLGTGFGAVDFPPPHRFSTGRSTVGEPDSVGLFQGIGRFARTKPFPLEPFLQPSVGAPPKCDVTEDNWLDDIFGSF